MNIQNDMHIYNRTTNITEDAHDDWLNWMRKTHIPAMLATGKFVKALLVQVQVQEEMGGVTYSVQYTCESKEKLEEFITEDANRLTKEANQLFPNQFVFFETELKIVEEFTAKSISNKE